MLAQTIVSFREGFEAAIVIAVVLTYLKKTGRWSLAHPLLAGSLAGVLLSGVVGWLAYVIYFVLEAKELVEAIGAFIAVPVLTSVVYWMSIKSKEIKREIELRVEEAVKKGSMLPIAVLGLVVVFREGFETVLFILPLLFAEPLGTVAGVLLGVFTSLALAYLVFVGGMKLKMRSFFYVTSILLVLIAGGILGYGIHELLEYGEEAGWPLGIWAEPVYKLPFDEGHPLHDKGIIGSILSVFFGYAVEMELLRLLLQATYVIIALPLVLYVYRR